jgi:hypothetical protein
LNGCGEGLKAKLLIVVGFPVGDAIDYLVKFSLGFLKLLISKLLGGGLKGAG